MSAARSAADSRLDDAAEVAEAVRVLFEVSFAESSDGGAAVTLAPEAGGDSRSVAVSKSEPSAQMELEPGTYVAAVHLEGLGFGPVVQLSAEADVAEPIRLQAPYPFDLEFPVLDSTTEAPISGATMRIERSDLPSAWNTTGVVSESADSIGRVRFEGLGPGRWRLIGSATGYVSSETDFDYPGSQTRGAMEAGLVTLEAFYLPPVRRVMFQLVDHESWDDLTQFSIALTPSGDPVRFDPSGRAALDLGWYELPLYIKVDYPGPRASIRYLDGGLPEPDEVHELHVGGARELEIALEMTREIEEELRNRNPVLGVSFRDANGDAVKLGDDVAGPTSVVFRSVQSEHATITLETVETGTPVKWASRRVRLAPGERTSATLVVESPPTYIAIVDGSGAPLAGAGYDIRMIPDDTTWVLGGVTNERGRGAAIRIEGSCAICAYHDSTNAIAIDAPIDLSHTESETMFRFHPLEETFVEVLTTDGEPVEGVTIDFVGSRTGFVYFSDQSSGDGTTFAQQLFTGSEAIARLLLRERWSETPTFDLLPGRNVAVVHETGTIRVTDETKLESIRSLSLSASLADWQSVENLQCESTEGGALLCRVPVGSYEVEPPASAPYTIDVRDGAVVPAGI
ncbi:MAG: carboxypeptidase-like regulatory domain-containing protein [Planctomycetota bacterium]